MVEDKFSKYGSVDKVQVTATPSRTAFVRFKTLGAAIRCLDDLQGKRFVNGWILLLDFYDEGDVGIFVFPLI